MKGQQHIFFSAYLLFPKFFNLILKISNLRRIIVFGQKILKKIRTVERNSIYILQSRKRFYKNKNWRYGQKTKNRVSIFFGVNFHC